MRPLAVPLLLLPWTLAAHVEPLPGFLDSHEYERRLPGANLPVNSYRPLSPNLRMSNRSGEAPGGLPAETRLQQYTERLTQRYRQEGYLLSYAYLPCQEVAEGTVNVVLIEGYIRDYRVDGDIGPASEYLQQLLARLKTPGMLRRRC